MNYQKSDFSCLHRGYFAAGGCGRGSCASLPSAPRSLGTGAWAQRQSCERTPQLSNARKVVKPMGEDSTASRRFRCLPDRRRVAFPGESGAIAWDGYCRRFLGISLAALAPSFLWGSCLAEHAAFTISQCSALNWHIGRQHKDSHTKFDYLEVLVRRSARRMQEHETIG